MFEEVQVADQALSDLADSKDQISCYSEWNQTAFLHQNAKCDHVDI